MIRKFIRDESASAAIEYALLGALIALACVIAIQALGQSLGSLLERGLVKVGDTLFDPAQRVAARVRADGSIACSDASGSIHKIGAHVQGAEACNGWSFWHVETKKGLRLIDELRAEIRSEMAAV